MWKQIQVGFWALAIVAVGIPRSGRTEEGAGKAQGAVNGLAAALDDAEGSPTLGTVTDAGDGVARLTWSNSAAPPYVFAGFGYDVYASDWVNRFWEGTLWCLFDDSATSGDMDLGYSGAYHVWISNQYPSGGWYPCLNPWTGIIYSGTPHTPIEVVATPQPGAANVRLHWKPDLYGTWCYEIIAYKMGVGWVDTAGPGGTGLWHFVDSGGAAHAPGQASFFDGWADFSLSAGDYWFFLRGVGWLSPYPAGYFKTAYITVLEPELSFTLPGGVPLEMLQIPPGSFQMGSPDTQRGRLGDEGPVHTVNIGYSFYLGEYEVTQTQWQAVTGTNPVANAISQGRVHHGLGDNYPVYFVSWDDCQALISALKGLSLGGTFRLPSEAEWEYACRAGTQTRFFFGDSLSVDDDFEDGPAGTLPGNRSDYMWWCFNERENTNGQYGSGAHPVGTKLPNQWGLYDMSGNVLEWCQDYYHNNYSGAPADGNPWESLVGSQRVCRGGDWLSIAYGCRSALRDYDHPDHRSYYLGVRLAWTQN